MLKLRILILFTFLFFCLQSLCFAYQSLTDRYLPALQGNWYDLDGNVVLTFDGASMNGCPIVDFVRGAGGGGDIGLTIRIVENSGYRDILLSCSGLSPNTEDPHQFIYYNDQSLRRFPKEKFFESVGGLTLGMSKKEVTAMYGQADSVSSKGYSEKWFYTKLGLGLTWYKGIVTAIRIYSYGDRHFDRTGFNCSDPVEVYAETYSLYKVPKPGKFGAYAISKGEYLWFDHYPEYVELNLYSN